MIKWVHFPFNQVVSINENIFRLSSFANDVEHLIFDKSEAI